MQVFIRAVPVWACTRTCSRAGVLRERTVGL
jgi:hypothetical protein